MPGGFHPFHAGHASLYQSAVKAFPDAEVYVAATNDTKTRPFPFSIKEKLAKLAGVAPGHFVQVKSPFKAEEITSHYNPNEDVLIFVRSEKDKTEQPKPGGMKKDGTPAYFQPYTGKDLQSFNKHAYISYLPTVEFGPGITSASEIRAAWPKLNDKRKTAMVMSLYPVTQSNPKLAANIVNMLNIGMGGSEGVEEARIIDPGNVDVYYHPKRHNKQAKLIAQNIPSKTIDLLISAMVKKYNVNPNDFHWNPTQVNTMAKDLSVHEEIGGVGGGFGTNYPGTYEEENGPFTHKGGHRTTSLTTESVDYLDEK